MSISIMNVWNLLISIYRMKVIAILRWSRDNIVVYTAKVSVLIMH